MKRKKEELLNLPLKHSHIKASGNIVVEHWHSHYELIMLTNGCAEATVGKVSYEIKPYDIVFVNRTVLHSVYSNEKCELLGFVMAINNEIKQLPVTLKYNPIIKNENFAKLLVLFHNEFSKGDAAVIGAYTNLVTKLVIREISPQNIIQNNSPAIEYINKNFNRKITAEEIAENVNLSKYYFVHQFKKQNGITVNNYLTNVRIEKAIEMLNSNKSTTEIAENCGFSDEGYFCKVFKKVIGISVREYRKLNK